MTHTTFSWDAEYDNDTAPWVIGKPQDAVVALERDGKIHGKVLDPGCGAGEHTILLSMLGYDVLGTDFSHSAVAQARRNAERKGVPQARFEVADALRFAENPHLVGAYDTVVDSALFHVFGEEPEARAAYVRNLHAVCKPGAVVHILALSDAEPGVGPRISDTTIRESFGEGWEIEELRPTHYAVRFAEQIGEEFTTADTTSGEVVAIAAWAAQVRRL
ncbi:class I SAM-dependent methyltransferase [Nocardia gipuzkoensis]